MRRDHTPSEVSPPQVAAVGRAQEDTRHPRCTHSRRDRADRPARNARSTRGDEVGFDEERRASGAALAALAHGGRVLAGLRTSDRDRSPRSARRSCTTARRHKLCKSRGSAQVRRSGGSGLPLSCLPLSEHRAAVRACVVIAARGGKQEGATSADRKPLSEACIGHLELDGIHSTSGHSQLSGRLSCMLTQRLSWQAQCEISGKPHVPIMPSPHCSGTGALRSFMQRGL